MVGGLEVIEGSEGRKVGKGEEREEMLESVWMGLVGGNVRRRVAGAGCEVCLHFGGGAQVVTGSAVRAPAKAALRREETARSACPFIAQEFGILTAVRVPGR